MPSDLPQVTPPVGAQLEGRQHAPCLSGYRWKKTENWIEKGKVWQPFCWRGTCITCFAERGMKDLGCGLG